MRRIVLPLLLLVTPSVSRAEEPSPPRFSVSGDLDAHGGGTAGAAFAIASSDHFGATIGIEYVRRPTQYRTFADGGSSSQTGHSGTFGVVGIRSTWRAPERFLRPYLSAKLGVGSARLASYGSEERPEHTTYRVALAVGAQVRVGTAWTVYAETGGELLMFAGPAQVPGGHTPLRAGARVSF